MTDTLAQVLARAWQPGGTTVTAAELEALPVGVVIPTVIDTEQTVVLRVTHGWVAPGDEDLYTSERVAQFDAPVTFVLVLGTEHDALGESFARLITGHADGIDVHSDFDDGYQQGLRRSVLLVRGEG